MSPRAAGHALALLLALVPLPARAAAAGPGFDHATFDSLLARFVRDANVDYAAWKADAAALAALDGYLARLAEADTSGRPRAEQLALWINGYNAVTVRRVLAAYPVSSITRIRPTLGIFPGNGVWKEKHRVARAEVSLDDIEHGTLRRHFAEPRIHFAINCASKGCPPLAPRAYTAAMLEAQLDGAARRFIDDERWNSIAPGKPWRLSKIFDWYAADFEAAAGSVPAYVMRYAAPARAGTVDPTQVRWTTRGYDWSLNQAPAARGDRP